MMQKFEKLIFIYCFHSIILFQESYKDSIGQTKENHFPIHLIALFCIYLRGNTQNLSLRSVEIVYRRENSNRN